jgi:O-antigen/teichoic acid export membrane protein
MGLGLAVGVWLARYLGKEQFGRFNYALAIAGLFVPVAKLD